MVTKVLVAVDGSPFSLRAAHWGAEILNRGVPGTLTLIHVAKVQTDLEWYQGMGTNLRRAPEQERKAVDEAVKASQKVLEEARSACLPLLQGSQAKVETVSGIGDPAQQILEFVGKKPHDLIVMGSRGMGPIRGAILGSVSQKVLSQADCPVLIVK